MPTKAQKIEKGKIMSDRMIGRRGFVGLGLATAGLAAVGAALPALASEPAGEGAEEEADVVVIGAGGAGMTAAIKCTDAGLKVIVLEKEDIVGGNTRLASTNFTAAGAQVQKDAGIEGATPDALFDKLYDEGTTDEGAIRLIADRSGEAADFLTGIGMDLSRCWATFSCGPADGSAPGPLEVEALESAMKERGIDCRTGSLASAILRAEGGEVEGVQVEGPDGTYTIKAPAVILASGGYAANNEMVTEYDPRWEGLIFSCGAQATGEGTRAAIAAGAAVSHMDNTRVNPTTYYLDEKTAISLAPIRLNGGLMVATNASAENSGKRILNEEGAYTPNSQIIMENGGSVYMVFDQALMDQVAAIQGFEEAGYLVSADTVEGLADLIEVDKDAFVETCEKWAGYFEAKEDPDFGKTNFMTSMTEPPFYAVLARPAVQGTFGGVTTVPTTTEVLDEAGEVIPGLLACGECADDGTMGAAPTCVNVVFGTVASEQAQEIVEG